MKVKSIINICLYSLTFLFGLVFVVVGIINIKNGLQASILSIISGAIFSLWSLRHLIFNIMVLNCKDEDLE